MPHLVKIQHDGVELVGELALPDSPSSHAAVLVMSNAYGLGNQARERAALLAQQGYVALATDMYGGGALFRDRDETAAPFAALLKNPDRLRARVVAWYEALKAVPHVDPTRVAAIGFCFGGQCVLELARSGADVKAVVSYHGLLNTAAPATKGTMKGYVSMFTGALDPYVPTAQLESFRNEMIAAEARWQITVFGDAYHSFTDPEAGTPPVPGLGYNVIADRTSWAATLALLQAAL